jgi:hypothetical protein
MSTRARRGGGHGLGAGSLAVAACAVALACGSTSAEVLSPMRAALEDGGIRQGTDAASPSRADYCSGSGAPILVGDSDGGVISTCAGGLARAVFRYALCTCDGYVSNDALVTDSFDSAAGAYDPASAHAGGSVGTNGPFNASGPVHVGGTLWGADVTGLTMGGVSEARRELHANGQVNSAMTLSVGADAFVNGDVVAESDVTIGGTLHLPAGKTIRVAGASAIAKTASGPVVVPEACDCAAAEQVDVAAFVDGHRVANDDAVAGIDPRALENVSAALTLAVPCGRIFFTRVSGSGAIRLEVSGRTAIFVGGDLAPGGAFAIDVAPGGEVDLFVEGNVVAGGPFTLGSPSSPASARLYVGGTGTLNLSAGGTLSGNVYAPRAEAVLGGPTTVFGSIFVRRVATAGPLTIHYDEGVLGRGTECPSATGCGSCHDCGNQACVGGVCGACASSADCCAPLSCMAGRCVPDIR